MGGETMIGESSQSSAENLSKTKIQFNQALRGPRILYEAKTPQEVISNFIEANDSRGYWSTMAKAAGFHSSYLSQVMRGDAHLSQEQGLRLAKLWLLDENASSHFLDLVDFEKCSDRELKKFIGKRLEERRKQYHSLMNRLEADHSISVENQYRFYSMWYYSAAYMLLAIDEYANAPEKIGRRLGLTEGQADEVLDSLADIGLIKKVDGHWQRNVKTLVIKDFPMRAVYQIGWRRQAIRSLELQRGISHHSAIYTLTEEDVQKFKKILEEAVERTRAIGLASPGQELYCANIDLFRV